MNKLYKMKEQKRIQCKLSNHKWTQYIKSYYVECNKSLNCNQTLKNYSTKLLVRNIKRLTLLVPLRHWTTVCIIWKIRWYPSINVDCIWLEMVRDLCCHVPCYVLQTKIAYDPNTNFKQYICIYLKEIIRIYEDVKCVENDQRQSL